MLVDMRPVESSENITIMDEIDELLGTRRSYGWNSGSRPSMISAKYRLKEERRKVLKISVNKMKKIDDAESSLCRSVLINNTVKRLQAETRDERTTGRTSPASPPSPTSAGYGYLHGPLQQSHQPCTGTGGNPQLVDITNLRESPACNGAGNGVVVVGKTLLQPNNNNNNSNINNNNKPLLTDALQSSSLAADHHHPHHHHHHHHHHNHHQHHHHHNSQHLHPHQHHHQSSSSSTTTTAVQQQQFDYDDCEDRCDDDCNDDTIASIMMQLPTSADDASSSLSSPSSCGVKRKRPSSPPVQDEEPLDDLLSQFINCSGGQREDEDVNVVDLDLHEYPAAKRLRTDEEAAAAAAAAVVATGSTAVSVSSSSSSATATSDLCSTDCWSLMDTCCGDDSLDLYGGQVPAAVEHQDVLLPAAATDCCPPSSPAVGSHDEQQLYSGSTSPTSLSCGQASMFSEMQMQSAMFRNLIASLES